MIALLGLFSLMVALTILFGLQALAASRRQTRARGPEPQVGGARLLRRRPARGGCLAGGAGRRPSGTGAA